MCTKQLSTMGDNLLIQSYLKGNELALQALIDRHQRRLYAYIYNLANDKDLANDIFQETFYKVILTLRKGNYNDEGKFLPWLERIAHNLLIDHFRKDARFATLSYAFNDEGEETDIYSMLVVEEKNIESEMLKRQTGKDLRKLVASLPDDQKEVLMMRHYYDMSFKEIAQATNTSINTCLGRMRYALINLRKMIATTGLLVHT